MAEDMCESVNSNPYIGWINLSKSKIMTDAQKQTVSAGDLKKYTRITGTSNRLSLYVYNKAKTVVSKKKSIQKWSSAGFFPVQNKK
jgi:hypothetical protein